MSNKNPHDVICGANVSLQLWNGTVLLLLPIFWQTQSPIDIDTSLATQMTLVEDDFANFTFSVGYKIVTSGPLINDGGHTRMLCFSLAEFQI